MMWRLTDNLEGNSGMLIAIMGKDSFLRMAREHLEKHIHNAAAAELKGITIQARSHFEQALMIETDIRRVESGQNVA